MHFSKTLLKKFLYLPPESRRLFAFRAIFIGLAAGLSALALENGAYWLSVLRVHASSIYNAWIVLPTCGLIGGLISGFLVQKYSVTAYGSGIPQVRAHLLGAPVPLDLRLAIVKLIAGSIALGSGLFMGREGPTVHVGAAIAAHINKWFPADKDKEKQLIAAGAGAGLAAAFNAPIAGVLFVAEELLKDVSTNTVGTAILACFVASALTHIFNAPHMESSLQIQALELQFTWHDVLFWVLLGFLSGVFGTLFNRGVIVFLRFYRDYLKIPVMLRVGLAGLISGIVIAFIPADAHFRDYAALRDVIVAGHETWYMVPFAFAAFFFLCLLAYGSGAPGGLFAPAIVLGSAMGVMVSYIEFYLFGVGSTETMAMVGMGAFFAAVARVPITAVVIVTEITRHYNLVPALMVATATACFVGSKMEKGSVYDMLREYSGLDEEIRRAKRLEQQVFAKDLMYLPLVTVPISSPSAEWHNAIAGNVSIESLPVVDQDKFVGLIDTASLKSHVSLKVPEEVVLTDLIDGSVPVVHPDTSLSEILTALESTHAEFIPVVENSKLAGIIARSRICTHVLALNDDVG